MIGRLLAARVLATHVRHVARKVGEVIRPVLLLVGEDLPRDVLDRVLRSCITCMHGARLVLVVLAVMRTVLLLL